MTEKHRCQPPVDTSCCGPGLLHATEPRGTLWECHCGKLWRVGRDIQFGDAWFRAGWLARRRFDRERPTQAPERPARSPHSPAAEETPSASADEGTLASPEPSPLHAHEITPADAAFLRATAGAQFGGPVTLPSGKTISADEIQRWTADPI